MANTRRRRRQHSRTRGGKRVQLGRVLALCGVVLALLYFTFTKLLLDPFEEDQPEFTRLVPRDVDLFMQREALASDFSVSQGLPMPRVWEALRRTPEWKVLAETTWWQELEWPRDVAAAVEVLPEHLAQLPLDPLEHLFGKEVVLLGRNLAADDRWALLARLTTRAKLAVELFGFDSVLQESLPGAVRERLHDESVPEVSYMRVTPAEGGAPFFYARVTDLLVLGQDEDLVRDVLRLVHGGSELALGLSRLYAEHMPRPSAAPGERFSAGFTLRLGRLLAAWDLLPDRAQQHDDALLNLLLRLVDTSLIDDTIGRLELQPGAASVQMYADIDVGRAAGDVGGLLGSESFSVHEQLGKLFALLPRDTSIALSMNVSVRRFLTTVTESFSPDVRQLLDGALRDVASYHPGWQADTLPEFVAELGRAIRGPISFAARPLDHQIPAGSQPLPAMAFFAQVNDLDALTEIETALLDSTSAFGVGEGKKWAYDEGVGSRRYVTLENLPMEEIAYIVLDREMLVVSTDNDLLKEIVDGYTRSRGAMNTLPDVMSLVRQFERPGQLDARANLAGWVSADGLLSLLRPYAPYLAEADTIIDFAVERARQRDALLAREHPEYRGREAEMPDDLKVSVDEELDRLLDQLEQKRLKETVPRRAQEWLDRLGWLNLLDQAALSLRMGDRSVDFELRLDTVGG